MDHTPWLIHGSASLIPANRWLRCASVSVWLCFPSTQCELEEPQPRLRHSTSSPCLCSLPHPTAWAAHRGVWGALRSTLGLPPTCLCTEHTALSIQWNEYKLCILLNSSIYLSVCDFTPSSSSKGLTWAVCTHYFLWEVSRSFTLNISLWIL